MKNKWRFFAVTLAVVLCMTVFSVTAYAGGDKQIGALFGKTENWACVTYHRARKKIQEGMEGFNNEK